MNQPLRAPPSFQALPARPGLAVEILDAQGMASRVEAWDRLVARAAYPNPHFSSRVIAAHRDHRVGAGDLRFIAVSRGDELAALLPYRLGQAHVGYLSRATSPFTSPYVTNTTPLIAGEDLDEGAAALAEGLRLASPRAGLWRFPSLSIESPAGTALMAALRGRGTASGVVGSFERAVLDRRATHADFARTLGSRGKDLRRRRKRLAETGALEHRSAGEGPELRAAVQSFLELEQAGWKGARGTALACRSDTAAFGRALFGQGRGPVAPRADVLSLDGRPIAVSLALVCGRTATLLKTAYDEGLRSYAPGLLLEEDIVRSAYETGFADRLDSASLAGSVLDGLYPDREVMADLVVSTGPRYSARDLDRLLRRERRRGSLIERVKNAARRLRDR